MVALSVHLSGVRTDGDLLLARRQALPGLRPLAEPGLGVANGPANLDVGRPVAAHARLGQPGRADLQAGGRLLGSEEDERRRGRLLCRRAAGGGRLRCHLNEFPFDDDAPQGAARTSGLSFAKVGKAHG